MMTRPPSPLDSTKANAARLEQLRQTLEALLAQSLRRGFHGSVQLELAVQDGTIQHIRHRLEQLVK
jgi:hypothetical protein